MCLKSDVNHSIQCSTQLTIRYVVSNTKPYVTNVLCPIALCSKPGSKTILKKKKRRSSRRNKRRNNPSIQQSVCCFKILQRVMDTTIIEKYLRQLSTNMSGSNKLKHAGVYASDLLPTSFPPSTALVVNTMPHTDSGEHWVVFYRDEASDTIEYFDSYGQAPCPADFQKFIRRMCNRYVYNKQRLQGYITSVCGHYCLCYLYCRVHLNMSMSDFVQLFTDPEVCEVNNDLLINVMFKSMYL